MVDYSLKNVHSRGSSMIRMSRKEQTEAIKWSSRRSPLACLVYSMNGKWGTGHDNDENVISNFIKLWKTAKGAVVIQGKKRLEDLSIFVPPSQREALVREELTALLTTMPSRMRRAERYEEMQLFCRDMSLLFIWDRKMLDFWQGCILAALDGQGKYEERDLLYDSSDRSEELASIYAECLIGQLDTERAAEVLSPFRDSQNPDIIKQFTVLEKLRAARNR